MLAHRARPTFHFAATEKGFFFWLQPSMFFKNFQRLWQRNMHAAATKKRASQHICEQVKGGWTTAEIMAIDSYEILKFDSEEILWVTGLDKSSCTTKNRKKNLEISTNHSF